MIIRKNPKAKKRGWLFEMTAGKCFYCGLPTYDHGGAEARDWLFLHMNSKHVREHKTPVIRGGGNDRNNIVPACSGCNHRKGAFTLDEFRIVSAFSRGDLNYRFTFDPPIAMARDWLCCHSRAFQKVLILHNAPSATDGYRLGAYSGGPRVRGSYSS